MTDLSGTLGAERKGTVVGRRGSTLRVHLVARLEETLLDHENIARQDGDVGRAPLGDIGDRKSARLHFPGRPPGAD